MNEMMWLEKKLTMVNSYGACIYIRFCELKSSKKKTTNTVTTEAARCPTMSWIFETMPCAWARVFPRATFQRNIV